MVLPGWHCRAHRGRQKFPITSDVSVCYLFLCSFVFLFVVLLSSVVELDNGKIEIDGYNVRSVGLDVLRRGLALVPQDSTLFLGTLRDNL